MDAQLLTGIAFGAGALCGIGGGVSIGLVLRRRTASEKLTKVVKEETTEQPSPVAPSSILSRTGSYWSLFHAGKTLLLKDSKGLNYLQRLLQNPHREFHVLDILGGAEASDSQTSAMEVRDLSIGHPGDAGEMLDAQAKAEYRQRLRDLRQDLDEQRANGDVERAERTEAEIEFLARELARAIGLGGRDRRAGSVSERARINVTRALRTAIEKIAEHDAALADLLAKAVRTGIFCSYAPDATIPLQWRFDAALPIDTGRRTAPLRIGSPRPTIFKNSARVFAEAVSVSKKSTADREMAEL